MTRSRKNRNTAEPNRYVGRFAPSPTGPLHLGSLICALASYLDARHHGGRWLVRMEDLDPPRESAGAAALILESLKTHGLEWDGDVLYQSQRHSAYAAVVEDLLQRGLAFRCDCTRARLRKQGGVYRGRCRQRNLPAATPAAIRVRVDGPGSNTPGVAGADVIDVEDRIQPPLSEAIAQDPGDFIIRRKDGLYAYQLAVVIDDEFQHITHILRGSDLYDSTPRQVFLQRLLGLSTPVYAHIPVITDDVGEKLSKQTFAPAINDRDALDNLRLALRFLGQPPPDAGCSTVTTLLAEAVANWSLDKVPAVAGIPESRLG